MNFRNINSHSSSNCLVFPMFFSDALRERSNKAKAEQIAKQCGKKNPCGPVNERN